MLHSFQLLFPNLFVSIPLTGSIPITLQESFALVDSRSVLPTKASVSATRSLVCYDYIYPCVKSKTPRRSRLSILQISRRIGPRRLRHSFVSPNSGPPTYTMLSPLVLLTTFLSLVSAIKAPNRKGLKILWQDDFSGCQGCTPSDKNWNIALDINHNNELQDYTTSNRNIQLSGGHTLQLVPWKSKDGEWTSGRIETTKSWHAEQGKAIRIEASLRTGDAQGKQGIWPAFWMLGDSIRHGTDWPLCGELDIFERVNGDMIGYGTVHCGEEGGGVCNEPNGLGRHVALATNDFQTWSIVIDRRCDSWETEKITWLLDGKPFHSLTGAQLGDQNVWATLAHSPMYVLLNVAVGGNWPVSNTLTSELQSSPC